MPEIYMDVDAAVTVPVNILPLIAVADFKAILASETYNEAGLDLIWNFVTTAGVQTHVAVTPTDTGGDYDWVAIGHGMYNIEIPATGGASANNNAEGFGWFTGVATDALPWRGPVIGFRAAGLNNLLIDTAYSATRGLGGTALPDAAADAAGGLAISDAGGLDLDAKLANTNEVTAARMGALTDWINGGRLDLILDIIAADTTTDIPGLIATLQTYVDTEVGTLVTEMAKVPKSDSNVTWNATALASINAEVDGALNTAIPGSPTADSINERVKAIDDLTQASGAGDLASINTKIGTPANLGGGATLAANLSDIEGQTDDIGVAGLGLTAIPTIATVTTLTNLPAAPTNWLDAAAVKDDAVTKIQLGLSKPGTAQTITANQAVNVAQWGGANIVAPAVTGSPVVTLGATQAAYAPAKAGDSMVVSDKTGFALTSAYDPAKTAAQALALATAQTDLDTLTGVDGATLATLQANYAPAKAGNQMDLVNAPNATAVTAIQSGLATPTNITAGTITTVTNLTNAPTVGDLTATMKSSVNAEVVDALNVDTYAEPTGAPAATASLAAKIGRLYQALRNKITVTSSAKALYDDAGAALWSKALTDDGTTYTEAEGS